MTPLSRTLEEIEQKVQKALTEKGDLSVLSQELLGKNGSLQAILRQLKDLNPEERTTIGGRANAIKKQLEVSTVSDKTTQPSTLLDVTAPPILPNMGSIHPISAMIKEMTDIFASLSFEVVQGNELVTEHENFETLNIDVNHPARDPQDSFFVLNDLLLRTQTTAVQVLEMQQRQKRNEMPIRIVVPGKTYRRESDQTHSAMFHQIDAVVVDTQTTFADLRGSLDYFAKQLFGDTVETRFRPHHFPFTEPSAEMDIRFKGKVQNEGKHADWLEMGGCGMIHPEVLRRAGINPKVYQGWAFGMSIERPLMVRHQIPDLRLLFSNSVHFLDQFSSLS
jgi:phenylalanyl-tRNA synthetase alpha chain